MTTATIDDVLARLDTVYEPHDCPACDAGDLVEFLPDGDRRYLRDACRDLDAAERAARDARERLARDDLSYNARARASSTMRGADVAAAVTRRAMNDRLAGTRPAPDLDLWA